MTKEIVATKKMLTQQLMNKTVPAVPVAPMVAVVLLQEYTTLAFRVFESILSVDEQLAVQETFEVNSQANNFFLISGALCEAWVGKVIGYKVCLSS